MKILKAADVIILVLVSCGAIVLSVLHILHLLPSVHLDYPLLGVIILSLIGVHLGIVHFETTTAHELAERRFNVIADRLETLPITVFDNSFTMEEYLARRIREAKSEVCDLSWKRRISPGFAVGRRKASHRNYESSITTATKSITYREVFIFNDPRRIDKLIRRISEERDGYSCRYYDGDSVIPRLQFVIIDREEIAFFASSSNGLLCAIKSKSLCEVFRPYFDEVWENAIPIKDGPVLHRAVYDKIVASRALLPSGET